jgi:hypothetical protein
VFWKLCSAAEMQDDAKTYRTNPKLKNTIPAAARWREERGAAKCVFEEKTRRQTGRPQNLVTESHEYGRGSMEERVYVTDLQRLRLRESALAKHLCRVVKTPR